MDRPPATGRFNDYPLGEYPSMPWCDSTESKGKYSQRRNPLNDIVCAPGKPGEWSGLTSRNLAGVGSTC